MSSYPPACRCCISGAAKAKPVRSAGVPSSAVPKLISLEAPAGLEPSRMGEVPLAGWHFSKKSLFTKR